MLIFVVGRWKDLVRLYWPHHAWGLAKTHANWVSFCGRGCQEDCEAPRSHIQIFSTINPRPVLSQLHSLRPSPSHQPSPNRLIEGETMRLQGLDKTNGPKWQAPPGAKRRETVAIPVNVLSQHRPQQGLHGCSQPV